MSKKIVFTFEFEGDVSDLTVYINDELFSFTGLKGTYKKLLDLDKLKVTFQISGPTGTQYKITYTCTSDGVDKTDSAKPSPVESKIFKLGYKEDKLSILIQQP